jgi:threonine/homoserine/homoserine lactone efflux protein
MLTAWQALGFGLGLGIGAGITPGPLLALIINETLRKGWRAGMLVALAPPLGDVVVVALCFLVLVRLPASLLPFLGIGGGLYLLFLAWETLRTPVFALPQGEHHATTEHRRSLGKGLVVNLLNPHPYIFWLTVAGPFVTQSYQQSAFGAIAAFVGGFYGCLVGSKLLLALLVHGGRAQLHGRGYQLALRASGGLLCGFGVLLLWEGVRRL